MRRFLAVVAGVIAAAAFGVTGAGAASAATAYRGACVQQSSPGIEACAIAEGSQRQVQMQVLGIQATTNWYFPISTRGEFKQANTDLCLQVDHAAGNVVIEATCTGASYQKWDADANGGFKSEWDPKANLCLTYNEKKGSLVVGGCSKSPVWYQDFFEVITLN
jgi:hypothetical protein